MEKTEQEWREQLTSEEFHILRQQGTEAPFSGQYNNFTPDKGSWHCKACGAKLFDANMKFPSSCGWPSFFDAAAGATEERPDNSHGMRRTEIVCHNCKSHLGHVFNDGPKPSGLRYCINSVSLSYKEE